MKRNRISGIIDWDEVAVAWGTLLLPAMSKIVGWIDQVLRAIIKFIDQDHK